MHPAVDACIARSKQWSTEMARLQAILLGCGLTEELKWGKPCYSHAGKNIAIIQEMKGFVALMFFKGALLDDPTGALVDQGPNTRSARRVEFTSLADVDRLADTVVTLVRQAVAVEDEGREVGPAPDLVLVDELRARLEADPVLAAAFEALTPGRRREYHLHVSEAKRAATRVERVERCVPRILAGKGLRDR